MLSEREQRIWDEIERHYRAEAEQDARGRPGRCPGGERSAANRELPAVVIGGGWAAVLLVLFGVPAAGVAVGVAAALSWLLWRFLPFRGVHGTAVAEVIAEPVDPSAGATEQPAGPRHDGLPPRPERN